MPKNNRVKKRLVVENSVFRHNDLVLLGIAFGYILVIIKCFLAQFRFYLFIIFLFKMLFNLLAQLTGKQSPTDCICVCVCVSILY